MLAQHAAVRASLDRSARFQSAAVIAAACAVGLIAFSPLLEQSAYRAPLGFLVILPLLWAGLRGQPRDTATVALVLSGFAVWGTLAGSGPFAGDNLNDSFLILLMFMITTAVPSLALSADVAVRKMTEAQLRQAQAELAERVNVRTAALTSANLALHAEDQHRKRIESELDEKRLYLLEAQRLANLGNWVWDIGENKVTWSDQLADIYGVKPGDFDGTFAGYLRLIHRDDRERVRQDITQAFEAGRGFRVDERIVRPNGDVRYLQSIGDVIKDDRGQVVRMLGVCQDVTERVEAESALRESEEKLAQAHKMEAIGQLTGGIAHDFNNILMIVSGHAEMLRRRFTEPEVRKGIDAIASAARRGEGLTRQLLTFSRRQPLSPEVVDLKQRIEAVRDMLVSSLRGNVALAVDIPDDIWRVEVDVAEFELALVNIAVNARDAMPEGGTFTVTARNVPASSADKSSRIAGDHVELTLSDTGTGIPPDVISKIFDPFFTTKAVGKGTGLGLSQVYGFASQSRGIVTVTSEAGRGTSFALCLPRCRRAASPVPDPARPQKKLVPGEGTVLVVEDNPAVGDITVTLLQQLGYKVLRAENAADALLALAQRAGGRSRVQRYHHAERHERDSSRAGSEQTVPGYPRAADDRVQRRGRRYRGPLSDPAQAVRIVGAGARCARDAGDAGPAGRLAQRARISQVARSRCPSAAADNRRGTPWIRGAGPPKIKRYLFSIYYGKPGDWHLWEAGHQLSLRRPAGPRARRVGGGDFTSYLIPIRTSARAIGSARAYNG